MKNMTDLGQPILSLIEHNCQYRFVFLFCALEDHCEQAIIWSNEEMLSESKPNWTAIGADTRVDHRHVNSSRREETSGTSQGKRTVQDILWSYGMADIRDLDIGRNFPDHALHHTRVAIKDAEICEKCNYGHIFILQRKLCQPYQHQSG